MQAPRPRDGAILHGMIEAAKIASAFVDMTAPVLAESLTTPRYRLEFSVRSQMGSAACSLSELIACAAAFCRRSESVPAIEKLLESKRTLEFDATFRRDCRSYEAFASATIGNRDAVEGSHNKRPAISREHMPRIRSRLPLSRKA